ncbi:hypothetical protein N7471_004395 [Penicillium samsonianum]|uniref:uncharacterized protein n=1 Tax=Penicillium samsonianum TaxID=1882272 RepID=UPI002547B8CC|nr:uncharacterized protein N7471_004395 [Penicillium samsonianum]KAJ6137909.1 hypothetical protein N7471_004395 [Penicillium samsonianum]
MTTYTDSYLEGHHIREVFAIVEVKAAHRDRKTRPEILRQEAAQMVAWIMNDANSRQCPLGQ